MMNGRITTTIYQHLQSSRKCREEKKKSDVRTMVALLPTGSFTWASNRESRHNSDIEATTGDI